MKFLKFSVIGFTCALVFACASTPENAGVVSDLRDRYERVATQTKVSEYAPVALQNAQESVRKAEDMVKTGADEEKIEQQVYIANRKIDIVQQTVRKSEAEVVISQAESMRKDILIDARTAEAQQAKQRAQNAEQRAQMMESKAAKLQSDIAEITTKQTDRGLVLTLGDILFETGKANLMQGSERSLQRVSQFLDEYSERQIAVEGHTDSTGDASFNQQLSEKRAASVKQALVSNGVNASRVTTKGLGEDYPVATNSTREGRQQNRRVDIIIENSNQ